MAQRKKQPETRGITSEQDIAEHASRITLVQGDFDLRYSTTNRSDALIFNRNQQAYLWNLIVHWGVSPQDAVIQHCQWSGKYMNRLRPGILLGFIRRITELSEEARAGCPEAAHFQFVTRRVDDLASLTPNASKPRKPRKGSKRHEPTEQPLQPFSQDDPDPATLQHLSLSSQHAQLSAYSHTPQPAVPGYPGQYPAPQNPSSGYFNAQQSAVPGYPGQYPPPQYQSSGYLNTQQPAAPGYPGQYPPTQNPSSGYFNAQQSAVPGYPGQYPPPQYQSSGYLNTQRPAVPRYPGQTLPQQVRSSESRYPDDVQFTSSTRSSRAPADPVMKAQMEHTLGLPSREDSDYLQVEPPSRRQRHPTRGSSGSGGSASPARELSSEERLENARQRTPRGYRRDRLTPEQLRSLSEEEKDAEVKLAEWEQKQWAPLLARAGDRLLSPEYEAEIAEIWDRIQHERRNHENRLSAKRREQARSGRQLQGHLDERNRPSHQGQQPREEDRQRRSGGGGHEPSKKDKRPPNYPQEPKKRGDGRRR
ncbi:MAG: hypothetical protein HETSPECPRED_000316 [Heterodermia speciosa]|uniref:Uncharacterized protein n=1 Tax=Heterodermia speciosa TaxID=116794 RepID=A0A8H3ICU5_9LECA|nr:MAG: hypothetical protein HETSPECPRED_000316 [Heterodermia speciosa]